VPRDYVLPNKPIAKCVDCGFIFEPQELKRSEFAKKSRLRIRRDADTLEIVQKPLRTGLPLWSILTFVLFDLGLVAFYLYMKQLLPDEDIFAFFQMENDLMLIPLAVVHVLLLAFPLWAFFDWRTIRLSRERLEISGRWLFFPWRRTVSRCHVKKAIVREWLSIFYNIELGYAKSFVWIGCTSEKETEALRSEINHFLYTVEPPHHEKLRADSKPAFLSGTESLDPEIGLHCPDCGARLLPEKVGNRPPGGCVGDSRQKRDTATHSAEYRTLPPGGRQPTFVAQCDSCHQSFPIENAAAYRIDTVENKQPESITVEQTDDSLTMRYVPTYEKSKLYANMICGYICILMFAGMLGALVFWAIHAEGMAIGFWIIFFALIVPMIVFSCFCLTEETNVFYCDWTIHLDTTEARFELRCKKRLKTIVIPREKIVEALPNERTENPFKMVRYGYFPDFLWSRKHFGGHLLLEDGTKHYLPLGTLDNRKQQEVTNWMLTTLNRFLVAHPRINDK